MNGSDSGLFKVLSYEELKKITVIIHELEEKCVASNALLCERLE